MKINVTDKNFEQGVMYRQCSDANTYMESMNRLLDRIFHDETIDSNTYTKITSHAMKIISEYYGM